MIKIYGLVTVLLLLSLPAFPQPADWEEGHALRASLQMGGMVTSDNEVPFWMRTNTYGSIPLHGVSGFAVAAVNKDYHPKDSLSGGRRRWDWGGGVEARINAGDRVRIQLITGYLKARCGIFQLQAGRTKDKIGLADTTLSSGAFAISGNALGVPKLELSIPEYWNIPGTMGLVAIKGNLALGYVGEMSIYQSRFTNGTERVNTYYHQKSLYGRIGKSEWKLKFYGGFNHQVMFGNERKYLGPYYDLSSAATFFYALSGKAYGNDSILSSKIGNHIGSIDQAVSYNFNTFDLTAYHQFFYDVGALYHLRNLKDGLWGISISNKNRQNNTVFRWHKFLVEFLYTKSQGGELSEKPTPSGDENYYNNYIYTYGWMYKGQNIGSNFFTNKNYQRVGLPAYRLEYIGNNRIVMLHLGAQWQLMQWSITNKFSFSRNYGTYATSPIGNTTGKDRFVQPPPYFTPVNQFSGYIEASRPLKDNLNIGFALAADYGDLLYHSVGGMVKLTRTF